MFKLKPTLSALPICVICFLISLISVFAEESLTITTYYPSPYGSYRELRAQRIAIGDTYIDGSTYSWDTGSINANADLVVEGNVGIGTTSPGAKLEVAGQVKITGGSPGAGKVLTSDAAGLASWQPRSIYVKQVIVNNGADCQTHCCNNSGEIVISVEGQVTGDKNLNVLSYSQNGQCVTTREGSGCGQDIKNEWITCARL